MLPLVHELSAGICIFVHYLLYLKIIALTKILLPCILQVCFINVTNICSFLLPTIWHKDKTMQNTISGIKNNTANIRRTIERVSFSGHCLHEIFALREGRIGRVPDAVVWPSE